ncbi:DnaT-like ssDNA-binding domain-containing protein [Amphritea sp.]|uniref:DnaT-like ssDNA-binding domain-containing protein n=1 Tax=Amphritea sp. TaxID=1872502 RepID=UPI003A948EE5
MSFRFPEKPVLFYPSLARTAGSDEAILLAIYHDYIQLHGLPDKDGVPSAVLSRSEWLSLAAFWDEAKLAMVTSSLVSQGYVQASFGHGRAIKLALVTDSDQPTEPMATGHFSAPSEAPEPVIVQELPVVEQPPERNEISRRVQQAQPRRLGPAPTFGGSIGWSKSRQVTPSRQTTPENDFASRLNEIEEKNQKLHAMFLGWKPSRTLLDMLPRHSIPEPFAEQLLDEFILYWLDKDRKESNWDQKFLAWVKREWINKQTRDARKQRADEANKGVNHENTRPDNREKRKRVTAAIMDIKDTDW